MDKSKQAILEAARERFALVCDVEAEQLQREQDDLRFLIPEPEYQWDEASVKERRGDGRNLPPRPMLCVSKIAQPVQLVINQMRAADLGVEVDPISEDANKDSAEARQGLYRHIERKSDAEQARAWAFSRAVQAGRGAYRILTEYDDEGGHPTDQRIVIERIYNQEGVYFDPAATKADVSDGRFAFVVAWMNKDEFKRTYPKVKTPGNPLEWEAAGQQAPGWVREDDVLVAEYWTLDYEDEELPLEDGTTLIRPKRVVRQHKLCGWDVLESRDWPGKYIPLIRVIGQEMLPFDGKRRYAGMVRGARDAQRLYNSAISSAVERMNMEPRAPHVLSKEQIEGFESYWAQANQRPIAYLLYNAVSKDGTLLPPPQRTQIDTTGTSLALMMVQQADTYIQSTTALHDPSLGRESAREKSGKAILALQEQGNASTSHFMESLRDALRYEARIILDLMPHFYDRPGRQTRIVRGDDGKSEAIMINAPFVRDPRTGRPMPAQSGQQGAKEYDLSKGVYDVTISIGKAFQSRLEEGNQVMGELIAKRPELLVPMGDIWAQFQTFPGSRELAKRLAKMREQQMPGLGEGEDGQAPPEQMQAQLQQMGQQMQAMQQQLQAAMQALETEQAKQQAAILKAQLDAQTTLERARLDSETRLRIAGGDNQTKLAIAGKEAETDEVLATLKLMVEAAAARRAAERDQEAEDREDARQFAGRQHDVAMNELSRPEPERPEPLSEGERS